LVTRKARARGGDGASATQFAAGRLRELILEREDGSYLGSQDDLLQILGVGRVSLHQAARILEQERLLRVRRGVNGGYYGTLPDEQGVERAVAVYLRANKTNFTQVFQVVSALSGEVMRLAALSTDEVARSELRELCEALCAADDPDDRPALIKLEGQFNAAVLKLAANPLGELMLKVAYRMFFESAPGNLLPGEEGWAVWRTTRLNQSRAILEGDEDYVQILSRKFTGYLRAQLKALGQ
jgi:GntR family transcriptional repressor for pyruvate dehydrogenase complex